MNPEDAERWKELERRARERGWTIDSLEVQTDQAGDAGGEKGCVRAHGTRRR